VEKDELKITTILTSGIRKSKNLRKKLRSKGSGE
jgi:hypothetical protein